MREEANKENKMRERDGRFSLQKRNKDLFDEIAFFMQNNIDDAMVMEVG